MVVGPVVVLSDVDVPLDDDVVVDGSAVVLAVTDPAAAVGEVCL